MTVWVVFDLDNTLILNTPVPPTSADREGIQLTLYQDTQRVLQFLADRRIPIAMASFRTNAITVLQDHGLDTYFNSIRYTLDRDTDKRTKYEMIQELATELRLSIHDVIFFDDLPENVVECGDKLIHTVQVDPVQGVTLELLFDALLTSLSTPFYVLSTRVLPQEEIVSYLGEYRVVFLTCPATSDTAYDITEKQPSAVVMLVPAPNTIELFYHGRQVRVTYPDLWKCLDSAIISLQEQEGDEEVVGTVGTLLHR